MAPRALGHLLYSEVPQLACSPGGPFHLPVAIRSGTPGDNSETVSRVGALTGFDHTEDLATHSQNKGHGCEHQGNS